MSAGDGDDGDDGGFPWYLKLMFLLAFVVVAFIVVVDLLQFAGTL
ncbi:MAG: hypothetical protein ABEJ61_07655 [Haloferacaceae archaeon]